GDLVRADSKIVVLSPTFRHELLRAHDPADTNARNAVGLRQAAGDDHPFTHAPEAPRAVAMDLRAEVDFVREQVSANRFAPVDDALHGVIRKNRSGRVIRVRDVDEPCVRVYSAIEFVPIRFPILVYAQMEATH